MARSAAFVPASPPGIVSDIIMQSYDTDDQFRDRVKEQLETINAGYENVNVGAGVAQLMTTAATVPFGPVGFMLVTQSAFGSPPMVSIAHAIRPYRLSSLDPSDADPTLVNKMFLFVGEIIREGGNTELPEVWTQPDDLEMAMMPSAIKVPTDAILATAFTTQDTAHGGRQDDVFPCPTTAGGTQDVALPKIIPIPVQMIPMLMDKCPPRVALDRVNAMVAEFPEVDRGLFDRTLAFLRAACVTVGGRASTKDLSRMASGWHPPSYQSGRFRLWKTQTIRSIYPEAFGSVGPIPFIPPAGLPPVAPPAAAPTPTFSEIMTGATGLVDHMATRMKESVSTSVSAKGDFKWSELTREAIIRAHGLPESTAWTSTEIAGIWYAYQEEMKNSSNKETAIQRVFHATSEANPSLDNGETLQPRLSSTVARHIRMGVLAAFPVTYDNCDVGFVPLAFTERTTAQMVQDDFESMEYDRITHRTVETERARSSRSQPKRPPATYDDSISLLRLYAEVIKQHFTRFCPIYMALNQIYQALTLNRETWKHHMNMQSCARFWWQLTKIVAASLSSPCWEHDGTAPRIDVSNLVTQISTGFINPVANLPPQFLVPIPTGQAGTGGGLSSGGGGGGGVTADTTTGRGGAGSSAGEVVHSNSDPTGSRVHPDVRGLVQRATPILGPNIRFGTILLSFGGTTGAVTYGDVILDPVQCQEFMTMGHCRDQSCTRQHVVGSTPTPPKLQNFITRVTPIVTWIENATEDQLQAARRRRRRRR